MGAAEARELPGVQAMTASSVTPLQALMASPVRAGTLQWIGLRPARRAPMIAADLARLLTAHGIEGDRYDTKSNGARQVTLIGEENLSAIASYLGLARAEPTRLRRNLVTSGINLLALKGRRFRIGNAMLEYSGECAPCSRMEEEFGPGGYNAVRGHGGITARIIDGGAIRPGDVVTRMDG